MSMLKNYVLVALRNLRRNRSIALINVFGLSVGLAACFIVGLFIHGELSYDRFHENAHHIERSKTERPSVQSGGSPHYVP